MHPTEALTTMSFSNFLRSTDAVGMFVFGLLILMSIVSWYFMILKFVRAVRIRTRWNHVVTSFWKTAPTRRSRTWSSSPIGSRSRRSRWTRSSRCSTTIS